MTILELREKIPVDVFCTLEMKSQLETYSNIQAKINRFVADGELIRLKRGLYAFCEQLRHDKILDSGFIAGQMYGPSYLSGDTALSHYGLIPEFVEETTSMCTGRDRVFVNVFGRFSYHFIPDTQYFALGVGIAGSEQQHYRLATPLKALWDKIRLDIRLHADADAEAYLFEDLRLDEEAMDSINWELLPAFADYARGRLRTIYQYLEKRYGKRCGITAS